MYKRQYYFASPLQESETIYLRIQDCELKTLIFSSQDTLLNAQSRKFFRCEYHQ